MRNRCFIPVLLCFLLVGTNTHAQFSRFYMRLGAGYSPMLNTPAINPITDPLISMPRHNAALSYELQWQINRRFGVVFQFRNIYISRNIRTDVAEQVRLANPYDFTTVNLPGIYYDATSDQDANQALVAVSYALELGKWSLQPRLMLGGTTYYPLEAEISIKRRDSNQLDIIHLLPVFTSEEGRSMSAVTLGAGALVQRPLWRRWSVFGLAEWSAFKPELTYTFSIENQVDGGIQTQYLYTNPLVQVLHLGGGLAFGFGRKK